MKKINLDSPQAHLRWALPLSRERELPEPVEGGRLELATVGVSQQKKER
jgi:hypothetical protein